MYNKYFGNFLLQKQIITPDQLKGVLRLQEEAHVKLGILAIESGIMNASQVVKVHHMQSTQDRRFGDLAVEQGYMTEDNLVTLLSKQRESHVLLGQILVDQKLLSYEVYESLLAKYREESGFTQDEIDVLKRNNPDEIVKMLLRDIQGQDAVLFKAYIELFVRNIIRFVDREMIIEKPFVSDAYAYENVAFQKIVGAHTIITGIAAADKAAVKFASIYADDKFETMDIYAKDSLGEFMNCQNGLFISNLYHQNIKCDLEPQQTAQNGVLKTAGQLLIVPCQLSFGKIDIVFGLQ
jgi:CheY-specific phosphatase CheX